MNDLTLSWLAGLLEGEGSFFPGTPSAPNQPIIALQMVDEDVVARVAALTGVRYRLTRARNARWSDTFQLRVKGKKARALMAELRPHMGHRRQAQIDAALASYDPDYGHKLSQAKADEIRRRFANGERAIDLAEEFGVTKWMIYAIHQGRAYRVDPGAASR